VTRTLIHSARRVSSEGVEDDAWVLFEGEVIAATGTGSRRPRAEQLVSADGRYLTAGFVDVHCHGGGGRAFDDGTASIPPILAAHGADGTTRMVASLVTASIPDLCARLRDLAASAEIVGVHLEGPFLAASHRGAHDPALLDSPTAASIDALLAAAGSRLVQVTIAPELPEAMDAIARFRAASVLVAIGHTGADYDATLAAFAAGASILTHAFNGMPELLHRAPGPVGAAFHRPGVTLELIADGVHVHPEVVRAAFAAAPGRIALVSDAMAAAGHGDGEYLLGSQAVSVRDGVARLADGSSTAGSVLTLGTAMRNAVAFGVPMPEAIGAITSVPARAAGLNDRFGTLAPGLAADAVLMNPDLTVHAVWRDGRAVVAGSAA